VKLVRALPSSNIMLVSVSDLKDAVALKAEVKTNIKVIRTPAGLGHSGLSPVSATTVG
jgi:hypothetical protein